METEKKATLKIRATPWTIGITVGVVVVIWGLNLALPFFWSESDGNARGTFGDMFGAVNSLFSALAFVALVAAILLQREELGLQRKELEFTRLEMSGQKEQLAGQKRQMEIQNFENRFFQMVKIWNDLPSVIMGKPDLPRPKIFTLLVDKVREYITEAHGADEIEGNPYYIDLGVTVFFEGYSMSISNYLGVLHNIMDLIERAEIDFEDRRFYSNIVRAQLSQPELAVIFYIGLSTSGRLELKPIIEKYSLLRHMDTTDSVDKSYVSLYDPKAFE